MEIRKKAAWPIWAGGAVFCLYGGFMPFYRWTDIAIAAALAIIGYIIASKVAKPIIVKLPEESLLQKTGDAGADAVIEAGKKHIAKLTELRGAIKNAQMTAHIDELTRLSRQIFKFVAENPGCVRQLNKFMDYYCPESVKLLDSYAELEAGQEKTEQMLKSMLRIEAAAGSVAGVYKNQLDSLYADKALDIKTDIEVLEQVLKADSITN